MTTELDTFETRLLAELREHVSATPARPTGHAGPPGPARRRSTRRWVGGIAAAAAAAMVGVLVVPGLGTTPAYSVQEGNSGEIEVEINRPEDAAGLERALEEHGIAADITYLSDLQSCAPGRYTPVTRDLDMGAVVGERHLEVRLGPGTVRDGETFVLTWSVVPMTAAELEAGSIEAGVTTVDGFHGSIEFDVAAGPVAPCKVIGAEG